MSWLLKSSIGRKFIMALSGLCLVLFLLFHMIMNFVSIISIDAYQMICGFLGTNWYALVGTGALAALFLVHILYAITLTLQNKKARGNDKYAINSAEVAPWSSKNMFVLGLALLAFLVVHLYDFWFHMMFAELLHLDIAVFPEQVGEYMFVVFGKVWRLAIYLIGIIALWFHLTHGVWSMFQTAGLNGRTWAPRLRCVANIVSTVVAIGFALVPIYFFVKPLVCTIN